MKFIKQYLNAVYRNSVKSTFVFGLCIVIYLSIAYFAALDRGVSFIEQVQIMGLILYIWIPFFALNFVFAVCRLARDGFKNKSIIRNVGDKS